MAEFVEFIDHSTYLFFWAVNKTWIPDSRFRIGSDWTRVSNSFWCRIIFEKNNFKQWHRWIGYFFFWAACASNKENCFSCITSLKIHHQLQNHCKELFSPELHWEIFCSITSCDYNSKTRLVIAILSLNYGWFWFGTKQFYKCLISTMKDFMICTDQGLLWLKLYLHFLQRGTLVWNKILVPTKRIPWKNVFHKFLWHTNDLFLIEILLSLIYTGVLCMVNEVT